MYKIRQINNGILNTIKAMPQKEINGDNENTFSMNRELYSNTINANLNVGNNKKWYGNSSNRDASSIAKSRRINEIGNGVLNAKENPMSFTNGGKDNDVKSALNRVRNKGYTMPLKKKYMMLDCKCGF